MMIGQDKAKLRYTGLPFVDNGVATITAFAEQKRPEDVTAQHIESFVSYAIDLYMNPAMAGYLSYVVFANARFANPAQIKDEKYDSPRRAALQALFSLWKWQPGDPLPDKEEPADPSDQCIFSGDPAVIRASRMLIPMTGSEDAINFVPEGRPRLPISGWCLLAILAMPLGTLNSEGKTFLVHSYDPDTQLELAASNLNRNRQTFQLQGLEKRPNHKFPKTHLLRDLLDAEKGLTNTASITAYLFTSSSQNSQIDIFHLPASILIFIKLARRLYPDAWRMVVQRAWALEDANRKEKEGVIEDYSRNYFYEDLFELPERARYFLYRYLLRRPQRVKNKKQAQLDPRTNYSPMREREAISWGLITLFAMEVMNMDRTRIEKIKELGTRLAEYIQTIDSNFYRTLYLTRKPSQMRMMLIRAAHKAKSDRGEALLPIDDFVTVFFEFDGDVASEDWYLAFDLLLIRVIEELSNEWVGTNEDLLEEVEETATKLEPEISQNEGV